MTENYQCKSIIKLNGEVTTILLLKNKKDIVICLTNGFIKLYNLKLIKPKLSIELINSGEKTILDVIEFQDNKIILSCWDNTIKYIELYDNNNKYKIKQILNGHSNFVNSLRKLFFYKEDIIIASSSSDGLIIFWKYENDNFTKLKEIKIFDNEIENGEDDEDEESEYFGENQIESMEESVKYQELICGNFHQGKLCFINLNDTSKIEIKDLNVNNCIRALKIIKNGDILIVAGFREINIIKLENKSILNTINYNIDCEFNCIFQKENGNLLITEYGDICKINEFIFDEESLNLKLLNKNENDFKNFITTIIELDNGELVFGSYDYTVKFFEVIS